MKYSILFISFILFFSLSSQSQKSNKDDDTKIPWTSEYSLVWDDFQAKPRKSHFASALSDISFTVEIKTVNNELDVVIQTTFNRDGSWVKEEDKVDHLLKHEQSHFDLYEVNARKFRKDLQSKKLTMKNVQDIINRLSKKYNDLNESSQKKYDEETSHSLKERNQEIWNERIAKDLKELSDYSSPNFRVKVEMN